MNKYICKFLYPFSSSFIICITKEKGEGAEVGAESCHIMMHAYNYDRREGQKDWIKNVSDHSTVLGKSGIGQYGVPGANIAH